MRDAGGKISIYEFLGYNMVEISGQENGVNEQIVHQLEVYIFFNSIKMKVYLYSECNEISVQTINRFIYSIISET